MMTSSHEQKHMCMHESVSTRHNTCLSFRQDNMVMFIKLAFTVFEGTWTQKLVHVQTKRKIMRSILVQWLNKYIHSLLSSNNDHVSMI